MSEYTLWPGSPAAISRGCECPRLDNGHGNVELARDRGGWWQFSDCPVHGVLAGGQPAPIPEQPDSHAIDEKRVS